MIKLQAPTVDMPPHPVEPDLRARVTALFEDEAAAGEWLGAPNPLFGGQTPDSLLPAEAQQPGPLTEFLCRAEAGDFS
jgi:uncharacterized protein (DUF2384 family)